MKKVVYWFVLFSVFVACKQAQNDDGETLRATGGSGEAVVDIVVLQATDFYEELLSNGKLQASQRADLYFKTSEVLIYLPIQNGSRVQAGQVLARLDSSLASAHLAQALAQVARAEFDLQTQRINYGYHQQPDDSIPPHILKSIRVQSGWLAAQANLQQARIEQENLAIKAPFSGIVANLNTKLYNRISTSEVFCTLLDNSQMEVVFPVLESELQKIRQGQQVVIRPVSDTVQAVGLVSQINPSIQSSGMTDVKALLSATEGFYDGMNVLVSVRKTMPNSIVIPKNARVIRSGREVVFVYQNGLAKWKYIVTSGENSNGFRVVEGLNEGDSIIVSGNLNLAHDAVVSVNSKDK